jgi:Phosphotransferase enzyme family
VSKILSAPGCSKQVVRITDSLVVKFGLFVTVEEFKNQQMAKRCLNPEIVHVPSVHRFLQKAAVGYIVIDFVDGRTLEEQPDESMLKKLANILDHIHQQQGLRPGSLGGGPTYGVLWPLHEEVEFSDTDDFQRWLNIRSRRLGHTFDIHPYPLSMCHLDFNPRNIMVNGNRVSLIDWAAAGYFPPFFERIAYQFLRTEDLCFLSPAPVSHSFVW